MSLDVRSEFMLVAGPRSLYKDICCRLDEGLHRKVYCLREKHSFVFYFCSANFLSFSFRDILLAGLCIPFTLDSEIIHLTWNLGLEYCISYRWAIPVGFQDLTQFRYLWFIKWEILLISSEGEVQFLKWNNDLEQTKAASHQSSFEKCNDVQDSLGAYDVIPSWFL